jgi:4-hydroxythreonine-4-phosphate dehydrogenase
MSRQENIRIGITLGDFNGVGPEIILKALSNPRLLELCTPVVYGSLKVLSFYKKALDLTELSFNLTKSIEQLHHKKPNLFVCWEEETAVEPGTPSAIAGNYAFAALEKATEHVRQGHIDAIVTAPLDKSTVNTAQRPFRGHTEYLGDADGSSPLMLLVCDDLKIALATAHVPVSEVSALIRKDRVLEKIKAFSRSLTHDFGIKKPRIAVLGLNPHAGDNGLLGREDREEVLPAVEKCIQEGIYAFGPYPADGFFGAEQFRKFDGVLAMYHDQGLIPFKLMGFEDGVNFTSGLSFVRTSPDHGTAYAIAGKNIAIESSLRNAIYLAIDVYRRRKLMDVDSGKALRFTPLKRERFRMDF